VSFLVRGSLWFRKTLILNKDTGFPVKKIPVPQQGTGINMHLECFACDYKISMASP